MSEKIYHDLPAQPLHAAERESIAEHWLDAACQNHGSSVDIAAIVKLARIEIIELPATKMGDNEAYSKPQVKTIFTRQGFKGEIERQLPETLFKLAHEFAHCVLHRGSLAKPLKNSGNVSPSWIRSGESQEDQAWDLARATMLPRVHINCSANVIEVAKRFKAPVHHVKFRLAQLEHERRKILHPIIALPPHIARLWDLARRDQNYNSNYYRLSSKGSLVEINSYNRFDLPLGWFVDHGQIYWKDEWNGW